MIASYKGRLTSTAGDRVLAEFARVVEASDCALQIQERLPIANANALAEHRLQFRIGLNVGDVMGKDGDIFSDGVNTAARLSQLSLAFKPDTKTSGVG